MFAVLDCGTTTTRVYIVDENRSILASGREKVGVRDTAITGSRDTLRSGITKLFRETLSTLGLEETDISYVIASGMITSELGLMEIPHLIAPAGLHELAESIYEAKSGEVLPIACPVYFIRGIRNDYGKCTRGKAPHCRLYARRGSAGHGHSYGNGESRAVHNCGAQLAYEVNLCG